MRGLGPLLVAAWALATDPACRLQREVGRCRAQLTRFYFDTHTNACLPFVWGGCGEAGNRWTEQTECEDACIGPVAGHLPRLTTRPSPAGRSSQLFRAGRLGQQGNAALVQSGGKERKKRNTCKKKPLQLKCLASKLNRKVKEIEAKMKRHVGKSRMKRFETQLTSRMNNATRDLANITEFLTVTLESSLRNSSLRLDAALASLAVLQANMTLLSNQTALWEQLNSTRVELAEVRRSQAAINSSLVAQSVRLDEQGAELATVMERLNISSTITSTSSPTAATTTTTTTSATSVLTGT